MKQHYDVVVIGAGPGGYVCAIRAKQLGLKTAIVEREYLGGVCLNVGCIPSKALISAGHFFHKLKSRASVMGIECSKPSVDFQKLQHWKQSVCRKMSNGVSTLLKGNGVDILKGDAIFVSPDCIEVKGDDGADHQITSQYFVVATGSRPIEIPGFVFDEDKILSSTGGLALNQPLKNLIVVGGGYIGLEIASCLCHLGTQVTVLEASPYLLNGLVDTDIAQVVQRRLKKLGVKVLTSTTAKSWTAQGEEVAVTVSGQGEEQDLLADKVLVAVGRRPHSDQMNLKGIGLCIDDFGFLGVNAQRRTNIPHIFAIGDIAGQPLLAHKASYEGVLAAEVIAGKNRAFDARVIPSVIFTDPEIASVGLTQQQCEKEGPSYKISQFPFSANGKAVCLEESDGFVKVIWESRTRMILGVHIVGPDASNLISEAALAIEMGATLEDVASTIHPHPTLSEPFMEACEAGLGHPIHILSKKLIV